MRNRHSLDDAERREASKSDPEAEARGLQKCRKGLRETVCPPEAQSAESWKKSEFESIKSYQVM